jgi:uncharacterized protein
MLAGTAAASAQRMIEREEAHRRHVVVYLSGSHAYGFPSPDSDLDLKAVHLAPTERILGLSPPRPAVDHTEWIDGVEVDYTSNELGQVLHGVLGGNGNYLERLLGPTVLLADEPLLERIRGLAPAFLSRRVHAHYRGFAKQQHKALEQRATAKRLLYVLRTLATGTWLLERGEVVADLGAIAGPLGIDGVDELVALKQQGERAALESEAVADWGPRVDALFARIDTARDASVLPPEPPDPGAVEALLVEVRRASLR